MDEREYWTTQMEEAFAFMQTMRSYPLEECGENLGPIKEVTQDLDVTYDETPIAGYPRVALMREGLLDSFRAAMQAFNRRGWQVRIRSTYRSPEVQRALSRLPFNIDLLLEKTMWELNGAVPEPDFLFRRLSAVISTRCRIGTHVSASAADVVFFDRTTGAEIERGGPTPQFTERTPMNSPFIQPHERENRRIAEEIFREHNWIAYPYEFWHFSQGDCYAEYLTNSGRPSRYGPVYLEEGKIRPMTLAESDELISTPEVYAAQIPAALERLRAKNATSGSPS